MTEKLAPSRTSKSPDPLTLISAVLLVGAFPPWNLAFLAWFCLVPWFLALRRAPSLRHAFAQGVWLSFFMSLLGFYWVASVLHQFGGLPWPLSVLGLLLFGLGGQPQFLLFPLVLKTFERFSANTLTARRAVAALIGFALLYAGIDWALPKLFADTLGHAMYAQPELRQLAEIGGAHLITFVLFAANYALFELGNRLRQRNEPSIWPALRFALPQIGVALALVAAGVGYGNWRAGFVQKHVGESPLQVRAAAIQGNIGDFDKIASERGIRGAAEKVLSTYFNLSDHALAMEQRPEFLVWPETAYPSTFRTPNTADELSRDQKVETYVRERGVPLLFGGYDRAQGKDFNALFLLHPKADETRDGALGAYGDLQIYRKNILLLFGEYIPGADKIGFIRNAFPQVGNFGRGAGPEVVNIPVARLPGRTLKAGPIICYEALFPDFVIGAARKGSQLILNVTNDSWFGPYGEPDLHLALAAFRSIETRLPQLRSTNTGFSALILPDGTITDQTKLNEAAILNTKIPVYDPIPTLMKAWGDWFGVFALAMGSVLLAMIHRLAKGLKGPTPPAQLSNS